MSEYGINSISSLTFREGVRSRIQMYLGSDDEALCRSVEEKAMVIGYTRMLRRAVRRPNEAGSAAMIEHCKKRLAELLEKTQTLEF